VPDDPVADPSCIIAYRYHGVAGVA
jgi:hypothetical protein